MMGSQQDRRQSLRISTQDPINYDEGVIESSLTSLPPSTHPLRNGGNDTSTKKKLPPSATGAISNLFDENFKVLNELVVKKFSELMKEWEANFRIKINDMIRDEVNAQIDAKLENLHPEISSLKTDLVDLQKSKDTLLLDLTNKNKEINDNLEKLKKVQRKIKKAESDQLSDSIIISCTKRDNKLPPFEEGENLINKTAEFLRNTSRYNVQPTNISSARRMGSPLQNVNSDQRNILVKFSDKGLKRDIILAHISQRNTSSKGIFLNEYLTNDVNNLLYCLRNAKKDNPGLIKSIYTVNGQIRIKLSKENITMHVLDEADYEYVMRYLKIHDIYLKPEEEQTASSS